MLQQPHTILNFFRHIFGTKAKAILVALLVIAHSCFNAQNPQIQVSSYTVCPNQPATVTAVWNNVGFATYSLTSPAGGLPGNTSLGPNTTFTIAHPGTTVNTCYVFTLSGQGQYNSAPITSSVVFNLCIDIPAPLTITNNVYYCSGQTATLIAPIGGTTYVLSGPVNQTVTSNIITFGPLSLGSSGNYTVTSIGTCTASGSTTISVAPITPIAVNASSNVCQWLPGQTQTAVNFTSALTAGQNFQWFSPLSQLLSTSQNFLLANPQPTDAGVYTVSADIPWGTIACPRTATTLLNVVQTSPVSVAASPSGVLCQGDKLSFSAVAGGAIGWSWAGPQAFAASISNPTINPVAPNNSGNYTVTALFTNNIITCTTNAVVNVSVVTVNQPLINIPNSVCQNVNVNMSSSAIGATSYTWFGPNSFTVNTFGSVSSTSILNVQPNASGIYYVTAGFGQGCSSTNSTQLNVVPVNSVTVIPPAQVCQPNHGYLQASAIGANGGYVWVGPNGFSFPGSNATVYYPTPGSSGIYTVTAYFNGNNLTCSNTNTVQLVVNPILTFSLINRQQVCYNTPLSVTGPSGATSYTWTSSNGYTSNNKDISFTSVQPNNSGTYTLNISLGPCITSASTTIEVLTPVQFTLSPQNRSICKGDTTVLEAGITGGSQNYAYLWNPAVYFDNPVGPKKIALPEATIIYNVIAHDIACPNYTIAHSFSVTVNQPPKPDLQLSKTGGCAPLCINFDTKLNGSSAITTYDFGNNMVFQNDNDVFKYCLNKAGTYSLTMYTVAKNSGCKGKFPFPYPLEVYPKPKDGSTISWTPQNPTTTDEVTFNASFPNKNITSMQWSFSGGIPAVEDTTVDLTQPYSDTSNLANPVRKYYAIGKYPVVVIVKDDKECVDTIPNWLTITDDFRVYIPNTFTPNGDGINDVFKVIGSGMRTDGFNMQVSDRWGNVLFTTRDITEGWDGKYKGQEVTDAVFIYKIMAVGMNGEGRREFTGYVTVLK